VKLEMVLIPAGEFKMGNDKDGKEGDELLPAGRVIDKHWRSE